MGPNGGGLLQPVLQVCGKHSFNQAANMLGEQRTDARCRNADYQGRLVNNGAELESAKSRSINDIDHGCRCTRTYEELFCITLFNVSNDDHGAAQSVSRQLFVSTETSSELLLRKSSSSGVGCLQI
jgi:hypothetical protein